MNVVVGYDCPSSYNIQTLSTLRIILSKSSYKLTVIDLLEYNQSLIHLQVEYSEFKEQLHTKPSHYLFPVLGLSFKIRDNNEDYFPLGV